MHSKTIMNNMVRRLANRDVVQDISTALSAISPISSRDELLAACSMSCLQSPDIMYLACLTGSCASYRLKRGTVLGGRPYCLSLQPMELRARDACLCVCMSTALWC